MPRQAKPRYIPLEKLFKLKIKRFPGLYRGKWSRMKAIRSLLTNSCSMWDSEGNIISTDPHILMGKKAFENSQKMSWERRRQSLLEELEEYKEEIEQTKKGNTSTDGLNSETIIKMNKLMIERREKTIKKYYTDFNAYQDEFEDMYEGINVKEEEIKDWLDPNDTGYGILEHIPDNAKEESLEIIKEYIEFIFENCEYVGSEMTAIAKNVNVRYFRNKNIDKLLEGEK